ncbi:BamA/TamA family outer membrane protein [Vibrio hippocampi]|uniref:Bacterial surface antigen (D15) domain-containing protein n=1 Tax=Vibrio hippocampi TaxID=654686 RepID=A0ABM8ZJN1_9VIBR|nr:BamA/TamA family outer membrane protein [Vibrio hippocampi]CAH0526301.1 hypothetical protein VHP8226_01732 [Vibrio hippocampi]
MIRLSSLLPVLLLLAPAFVSANESDVVLPDYAHLATDKDQIIYQADLDAAEAGLTQYETAIEKLEQDNINDQYDQAIENLEYGQKYYQEINGLPMFSFLGGPAYTPEQGLLVAAGGLYSFKTDRSQPLLQRSSASMFLIGNYVDSEIGYGLRSKHDMFWDNNDIRFQGELNAGVQSKHYWGIGYDAAQANDLGDETQYKSKSTNYHGTLVYRVHDDWYLGPAIKVNYLSPNDTPDVAVDDENFNKFKDKPFTWGIGGVIQYDTRDVVVNPWKGILFKTEALLYSEALGSQAEYQKLDVELRGFHSFSTGRVLALLAHYQQAYGDVPYYDMPELGGAKSMRGYFQGQYRDKVAGELTAEYRHMFRRSTGDLSNHGLTTWLGLGAVGNGIEDLAGHTVVSYGVGYRYELQPRMNIRLDLGMGEHGAAFYFNFTEAF